MLDPADPGLHAGMRCIHCRIGQPVHLYRVTRKVPMLACETCARRSGLERDDIDIFGGRHRRENEVICVERGHTRSANQHAPSDSGHWVSPASVQILTSVTPLFVRKIGKT